MAAYLVHAESLRGPKPAKYAALRIGPWAASYRASQARHCAAAFVQDTRGSYAAGSINKSLGTLTKALSLAYERGVIPQNYGEQIKRLPENNIRTVTLTLPEVERLASRASPRVRALIWIAVFTGCRRGEILSIRAEDIGEDTITLQAGMTKTERTRVIPITAPLRPWLSHLPTTITPVGLQKSFDAARTRAGLPHVTFHDLRRSCATLMLQAGVPMHVISKLLGHSSTRVTESRYAHLQIDAVRDGLDRTFTHGLTHGAANGEDPPMKTG